MLASEINHLCNEKNNACRLISLYSSHFYHSDLQKYSTLWKEIRIFFLYDKYTHTVTVHFSQNEPCFVAI